MFPINETVNQDSALLVAYIAPYRTTIPPVSREPGPPWVNIGKTDGKQAISTPGTLRYHRENDSVGPSRAVRGTMDVIIEFTLTELDLSRYARVLSRIENANVIDGIMKLPLKREQFPFEYSMILRGRIMSRFGNFFGNYIIPRGVFDGEPRVLTETTGGTETLSITFRALEDYEQVDEDYGLGWIELRTI